MAFRLDTITDNQPTRAEEKKETSFLQKEITLFGGVFSNKVKEDFYTELSVLLKAGIALRDALELLQKAQKKKVNIEIIRSVVEDVVGGKSFSEAIKGQKRFSEYEYYSIKIGEETGTLPKVAEQLGSFFSKKNEQRRNLISALTYPIIILATAVLVVIFMLQFVVPMFRDIFEQQQVELPSITQFIISLSGFVGDYGLLLILLITALFIFGGLVRKNKTYKKYRDKLILKIPFVGNFVKTVYLSQFTQAVSLLTASKVPMVNSIQMVRKMIGFYPLQEALKKTEQAILTGKPLSLALQGDKFFSDKMIAMVKVAEETNQNEFIFERLNQQYTVQVQQQSKLLSTVMEPFIILFVGVLVGVILVAMYLPMFKLSSVIG
jgi:type IV pilus assembly protein PilC